MMTWRKKYKENKQLLTNYLAYVEHCTTYEDRLKLCVEIANLQRQQQYIEMMTLTKLESSDDFFTISLPSSNGN